ncbi:MAG: type II toxin-antitoxin system RelE/ParE family toxin [Helicobacteraceae bacterium]|jgi:mRNA-degrading endonuclease RelE of RelBE toxin-antitoxin system|nr:type II toxin-antitoxin system RelE/ParE family toxin [Helicobacteraceae bacterium]
MALELRFSPLATKQMSKLDKSAANTINEGLNGFAINGRLRPKPLKGGYKGFFRLRFGDYRAVAKIYNDRVLLVVKVGHRKSAY